MSIKRYILAAAAGVLFAGCTPSSDLCFIKEAGSEDYVLPARQFDSYAKSILKADNATAVALLDKGYSIADSLAKESEESMTLKKFSDGIAERFFALHSPYRNDEVFNLALNREELCSSLGPDDFRRISWKRGLANKNAVGRKVVNIELQNLEDGSIAPLQSLIKNTTLVFVYGEECKACRQLVSKLSKSKVLSKAAQEGKVDLISIFAGKDDSDVPSTTAVLDTNWTHYNDYNCSIVYNGAFDGRLIPSLYLLTDNAVVRVKGTLDLKAVEKEILAPVPSTVTIPLYAGERVWGGRIADGKYMPYADSFKAGMHANNGNQVQPLLLTSQGRFVWSDNPFSFEISGNTLIVSDLTAPLETAVVGRNLNDAFHYASNAYFPTDGQLPPVEFFEKPQYNTWIELQYNQNQKDVLEYARGIIRNGLPAGIIMIDDTWMEDYGKWVFHPGRFPDPKAMCDELHRMGFKLMLWVAPYVSMDQYQIWYELLCKDAFVKTPEGKTYPVEWWNGYSGCLDFSNPAACEWFEKQLDYLCDEYGVDGFKFDGADFNLWPDDGVTYGNEKNYQLCADFAAFGAKYPYNEYRACWKNGGKPLVQRLHDKSHNWESAHNLIPEMFAEGLMGYYYSCPDMVGGGSFASFLPGCVIDEDLIVRSAQIHALMPMMQFSVAPWRILDKEHLNAVLKSVKIRQSLLPEIVNLMENAAQKGEPVITPLEFYFPHSGYEEIIDQFMLGSRILVAPMVYQGTRRDVVLPKGTWLADDGTTYTGGQTISIDVPLDRIPYFRLIRF